MISFLRGIVQSKQKDAIVLLTNGGVGYEVHMGLLSVNECRIGEEIELYTYMKVSDSAMALYGFENTDKREFFMLLLGVKNVGPKSALNILSLGPIHDIKSAIVRGDATYLSAVQGMGKKTAERLVVELKSKVAVNDSHDASTVIQGSALADVIDALVSMGYSKEEAKQRVQQLDAHASVEELLKQALRQS